MLPLRRRSIIFPSFAFLIVVVVVVISAAPRRTSQDVEPVHLHDHGAPSQVGPGNAEREPPEEPSFDRQGQAEAVERPGPEREVAQRNISAQDRHSKRVRVDAGNVGAQVLLQEVGYLGLEHCS